MGGHRRRHLGANACRTSLVVIPDDGQQHARALGTGTTRTAFDGVKTGGTVEVRMAVVVEHPDGDGLIGDILETGIARSLTEPAFSAGFLRVTTVDDIRTTNVNEFATEAVPPGTMYGIGCNENFGNYRANGLLTSPNTPRFRMGLAHSDKETQGRWDDVNFEACIIRIVDEGGDRVFPHDVASGSTCGPRKLVAGETGHVLTNNTKPMCPSPRKRSTPTTGDCPEPGWAAAASDATFRGTGRLRVLASKRSSDTVGALAPCAGRRCENHGAVPQPPLERLVEQGRNASANMAGPNLRPCLAVASDPARRVGFPVPAAVRSLRQQQRTPVGSARPYFHHLRQSAALPGPAPVGLDLFQHRAG